MRNPTQLVIIKMSAPNKWQIYVSPRQLEYYRSGLFNTSDKSYEQLQEDSILKRYSDEKIWMDLPEDTCADLDDKKSYTEFIPPYAVNEEPSTFPEKRYEDFRRISIHNDGGNNEVMICIWSTDPQLVPIRIKSSVDPSPIKEESKNKYV